MNIGDSIDMVNMQKTFGYLKILVDKLLVDFEGMEDMVDMGDNMDMVDTAKTVYSIQMVNMQKMSGYLKSLVDI